MRFLKLIGELIGLAALYAGRHIIGALYQNLLHYMTPLYLRIAGSSVLIIFTFLVTVLGFSFTGHPSAVATIAMIFPFVYFAIAVLPAIMLPISAVIAGYDAAEPGDQSNFRTLFNGGKKYLKKACYGLLFIELFLLFLMWVPIGKSFAAASTMFVLLIVVLAALGTGEITLDPDLIRKKIWRSAWAGIAVLALFVTFLAVPEEIRARYGMDFGGGVTKTEAARHKSKQVSKTIVDNRGERQELYILAIMECRANTPNFNASQTEAYQKGCGANVEPKGLTRDEVRKDWPDFFEQENSGAKEGAAPGGKPSDESGLKPFDSKTWQVWFEKNVPYGAEIWNFIIVWHVYLIIGLSILTFLGFRKKKSDGDTVTTATAVTTDTKKVETKNTTIVVGGDGLTGAMWTAIVLVTAFAVIAWFGKQELVKEGAWPTQAIASARAQETQGTLLGVSCHRWAGTWSDLANNGAQRVVFDQYSGRHGQAKLLTGCRIDDTGVLMTVAFDASTSSQLPLRGECGVARSGVYRSCAGEWQPGKAYTLEWDARDSFIVKFYRDRSTDTLPVKTLRFVKS